MPWFVACSEAPPGAGHEGDEIANAKPVVAIERPVDGSRHALGDSVAVEVAAHDPDGRGPTVSVTASGDHVPLRRAEAQGDGYDGSFVPATAGAHAIRAVATDEHEQRAHAEVMIHVDTPEPEPERQPRITVSEEAATMEPGASRAFSATVEGVGNSGVRWHASDGSISGSGTTITYTAPTLSGSYLLTATAAADDALTATIEVRVDDGPFTLVVVPDTQNMIKREGDTMVDEMMQWIVGSADALNLGFVTHVGDVVDRAGNVEEWERADAALDRLDGVTPYSVALGDHGYEVEENMGTSVENYLAFFGPDRYDAYEWYRGASASGKNHYQVFDAGGRRFLHIALEWEAPGPANDPNTPLAWARDVLERHPRLPTIITTHAYVWDEPGYEGRTWRSRHLEGYVEEEDGSEVFPGSTGEDIFEALVDPYPQVFMMLSGHYHKADSGTTQGEYHQVSLNEAGLEVYEMLSNYQSYPSGGNGWLRTIEFLPGGGADETDRIAVRTYSPVLDEYQTDDRSEFHFDLSFDERLGAH